MRYSKFSSNKLKEKGEGCLITRNREGVENFLELKDCKNNSKYFGKKSETIIQGII